MSRGSGASVQGLFRRCRNGQELWEWVRSYAMIEVPRAPVCQDHHAPFEYLERAYFEPAQDLVVWAPRGGGKTSLGAVATLLDLLHKPGCQVRILGGSLEQSMKMWEHLYPALLDRAAHLIDGRPRARQIALRNGSGAAVLTQSQRAVRGLRVQKLRCDEVELFDPEVWQAAQLVTRSKKHGPRPSPGAKPPAAADGTEKAQDLPPVAGCIEALSTSHAPAGLMQQVIEQAHAGGRPVIRWCVLDVLERCPAERECEGCALWEECRGAAKSKCDGFITIDDAIAMKQRVSRETWEAEMLCQRPSLRHSVFPHFREEIHVREHVSEEKRGHSSALMLSMDFGFANPFVCLWIHRWDDGALHVLDEYVQPGRQMSEHLEQIGRRPWGPASIVTCDPSGSSRNDQTGRSNVTLLRQAGYSVRFKASHIADGLEMIRTALAPASGPPRLFIHPRCRRLIAALRGYRYADGGSELPIKDGEHDHLIDALRYHFVARDRLGKVVGRTY